jgi:restriction endonuclease S subunit
MAFFAEIPTSEIFGAIRLDAEFYQPKYQENEALVREFPSTTTLGRIATTLVKGIFDINAEEYSEEGIPFVRINNLKNCVIQDDNIAFITPERHLQESKTALKKYDLILSKTAYPAASLVQLEECNTSQDTIAVHTNQTEDFNAYLAVYLNTRFGLLQMQRLFQGNIQSHLSLDEARTITIPVPTENFQRDTHRQLKQSINRREQSKSLYAEAENLLLHELGLDTLELSHDLTYERNFNEVAAVGRFDAQYFAPRYQRAMKIMARSGQTIGSVAPLAKRFFHPVADESFNYIEIGNLVGSGYADSEVVMGANAPSRAQWIVESGDVITSTVRPIRRLTALIEPEQHGFVCSSGFAVLKPRDIAPEVLTVYLRLPIVSEVLDLHTTATMYPAIATEVLLKIPISQPSESATREIISKVQQSRKAREEAKQLLEAAKRRVEQIILSKESSHVA